MDGPLITILTATYNSEKVLQDCIDSIKAQDYKNYEHVIIDGGSKDSTIEIIKRNQDHVKYWISEPDKGVYDAWNKGIKASSGEWIIFIGSDDYLYPDALSTYVDYLKQHPEPLQLLSSKTELINSKGKHYRTIGRRFNWEEFQRANIVAHTGALHHKSLFEQYGTYDISYKICGDYELLLRAGKNLKAGYVDKAIVKMADGGLSSGYKVFKEHLRAVKNTGGLNPAVAYFDYIMLNLKLFVKKQFYKLNMDIYLTKEYKERK